MVENVNNGKIKQYLPCLFLCKCHLRFSTCWCHETIKILKYNNNNIIIIWIERQCHGQFLSMLVWYVWLRWVQNGRSVIMIEWWNSIRLRCVVLVTATGVQMKTFDERVPDSVSGWIVNCTWSTWQNHYIFFLLSVCYNLCDWNKQCCCTLIVHCAFSIPAIFYFFLICQRRELKWKIKDDVCCWNCFLCFLFLEWVLDIKVVTIVQIHDLIWFLS